LKRASSLLFFLAVFVLSLSSQARELKIGILPDADSLPLLVAEEEGHFVAEGVPVRLVRFQNPVERDAAFQAGAVDGVIADILAAILATQGGFDLRITSLTDGRYGIATGADSGVATLKDLAGKRIGLSANTIIQYMVDTFMTKAGVAPEKILGLSVPRMPLRLEMLLGGQIAAAGLPEPLLTAAKIRGARILASTDDSGLRAGVIFFSRKAADAMQPEIRSMYKAYWKAARSINADNDKYRAFLVDKAGFPGETAEAYRFVKYEKPRLPLVQDILQVQSWMRSRALVKSGLDPESLLDGRALAGW
jgi:NitT/TauT family transport system substrate-binding protein